jgi:hypothetical protein
MLPGIVQKLLYLAEDLATNALLLAESLIL